MAPASTAQKLFHEWRAARRQPAGFGFTGGLTPRRSPFVK